MRLKTSFCLTFVMVFLSAGDVSAQRFVPGPVRTGPTYIPGGVGGGLGQGLTLPDPGLTLSPPLTLEPSISLNPGTAYGSSLPSSSQSSSTAQGTTNGDHPSHVSNDSQSKQGSTSTRIEMPVAVGGPPPEPPTERFDDGGGEEDDDDDEDKQGFQFPELPIWVWGLGIMGGICLLGLFVE